ncbi:BadF/BadG/BcrA/BcrD ATPase family protein [Aestuariivirga sp. YIM B02566]|uniref:N-acetylglucosamine kinase n=1 Tax=Taklimakanibacter albus TaxID=2800327 RepID=A0ACC5R7U8_9HYPH|nr:BadF/BadG/BcrA/BcrD ATPase family protein [Aestuariivirga sp. YIM B02566]MBK1868744.1 N-acetylglucosamine kinase [Aestuariivirga sp. YIM B02566]
MIDRVLFMGVDGGGTKCRVRLRDRSGASVAEAVGGLANLYQDLEAAIATIRATMAETLRQAGLTETDRRSIHVGLGLAGAVTEETTSAVRQALQDFGSASVDVDGYAAFLGAHDGGDGGIVIAGTGSAGLAVVKGERHWIGGFGFWLGDQGSGAILGRGALRRAALALDNLIPSSPLLEEILAEFHRDRDGFADWARHALPRDYARYAPRIFAAATSGDRYGAELVEEAARAVARLARELLARGAPSVALVGGLAKPLTPFMPEELTAHLIAPKRDALDGAIMMARRAAGLTGWNI